MTSLIYYYTDLQRLFGLKRKTVWKMVREGKFPANIKPSSGRTFWRREEVDKWFLELPPVPHAGADE